MYLSRFPWMLIGSTTLFVLGCFQKELVVSDDAELEPVGNDMDDASDTDDGDENDNSVDTADTGNADGVDDGADTDDLMDTDTDATAADPVDYRATGESVVTSATHSINVSDQCEMEVTIYTPDGGGSGPLVILAHGFARGQTHMAGWANHYASWGLEVATPTLCHASVIDVDHEANGEDLVALNDVIGHGPVIYAGHSAGGLAAVVAAALDSDAVAVVGLDTTDSEELGLGLAGSVSVPMYGVVGEPYDCNAEGSGIAIYGASSDAVALRVSEADHCDFENETDWLCTSFCNVTNNTYSDADIYKAIVGLSTAAITGAAGLGDGVTEWWLAGGHYYDQLLSGGSIEVL